ncbi:cyclophilin type peptidyl-prolyl cis-trans isomerase, partial [Emiliania huxleyi CCMP1516]|uniref:Peptidyl-prolyl cis-trans isomerase n=3 Tax=Emiliania huxleyi TaxID=2903 RepID=A0A0D3IWK5_EMIH1
YRGTAFHRLLPGQLLHGGRIAGGDASVFGASFNDEPEGLRKDQASRGLLCMANSGPDTNASQFYITLAPCPHLSGSHVRFGRLVSG